MKTIYLRTQNLKELFADVAKVIDNYNGEIESEQDGVYCHYIGYIEKIPATLKEDLTIDVPAVMVGAYHANLLVSNDFDESIFKTKITTPKTPSHRYAL
jgi:hypothetical protein